MENAKHIWKRVLFGSCKWAYSATKSTEELHFLNVDFHLQKGKAPFWFAIFSKLGAITVMLFVS